MRSRIIPGSPGSPLVSFAGAEFRVATPSVTHAQAFSGYIPGNYIPGKKAEKTRSTATTVKFTLPDVGNFHLNILWFVIYAAPLLLLLLLDCCSTAAAAELLLSCSSPAPQLLLSCCSAPALLLLCYSAAALLLLCCTNAAKMLLPFSPTALLSAGILQ